MDEGRNGATSDNNDNTEIQDEEENLVLPNVRKYQAIDDTTCIVPNYPDVNVVVNSSSTAKEINVRDSITNKKVILAPGEGCVPSNIMREHDFDVKGFPLKHKTAKYGLHHPDRPTTITNKEYFLARLFHYRRIFSNDSDYLFMCQQFLERGALESHIDISVQKGIITDGPGGEKSMKMTDYFNVFQKVPGTPKYWQTKRNNLLAMINVLGPFQYFFTFSCAELRWTEIIASILRMKGHKVIIEKDGETDSIYVDGDLLIDYLVNTGQNLHEIIQKETFTITRMFDRKVKSLIKNGLMDRGVKGMNLKHYMYRIEFQARGKIRFIKFFEYTLAQIWLGD